MAVIKNYIQKLTCILDEVNIKKMKITTTIKKK